MKKFLLVVLGLLFILPVFGNTAELEILGSVAGFLSIASDVTTATITLDPTAGVDTHAVAVITERSNKPGGYEVKVSSDKEWQLVAWNESEYNTKFFIPYTFSYGGTWVNPQNGAEVTVTDTQGRTTGTGVDKTFVLHTNTPEDQAAGDYRDTLTFTISSK